MEEICLSREDIMENIIAIKVNRSYREDITATGLYDITRGYWRLNIKKAEQAEYAFSIYRGIMDRFRAPRFRTQKFRRIGMNLSEKLRKKTSGINISENRQ